MSRKSGKKLIIKKKITLSHSSRSKKSESTTLKPKKNTISGKPKVLSKAEQRNLRRSSVNVSKKNIRHQKTQNTQYRKKENVDYDVVIMVSSHERYEKVSRILDQIFTQETNYSFKFILMNDGSSDKRYYNIVDNYPEVLYLENKVAGGKFNYWKTINKIWSHVSNISTHAVIQLDDDFILCDNFIDRAMNEYFESRKRDTKICAISLHLNTVDDAKGGRWGYRDWVDGGTLFSEDFLININYKIDEINKSRWNKNPKLSSGVWSQISKKITKKYGKVHKVDYSLVDHDGNFDSKMNGELRKVLPINTAKFKKNE